MKRCIWALPALCIAVSVQAADSATATLPMGTEIPLVTATPLSSKTSVKGDLVALKTAEEVRAGGHLLIAAGTDVVGQVSDARAKGAMGMTGKLAIRPLYIRVGDRTVRLGGATSEKATVTAGAVIGMAVLTPGFTGRSAMIPQGTKIVGFVEHSIDLPIADKAR